MILLAHAQNVSWNVFCFLNTVLETAPQEDFEGASCIAYVHMGHSNISP